MILRPLILLCGLVISASALSRDCVVVPAKTLCGIPLTATQEAFEAGFGEPDGRIDMGKDRVGLFYGTNFVVIFWRGKIWSVENWSRLAGMPWMDYVAVGRKDRETKLVFHNWNPWTSLSNNGKKAPKDMPEVSGDEWSDVFSMKGGAVTITYEPMINEVRRERWSVSSIIVSFDGERSAP